MVLTAWHTDVPDCMGFCVLYALWQVTTAPACESVRAARAADALSR